MATMSKTQISNPLITLSVQDFMKENGFNQVHREVRENTNGYPYITFINRKNEAENIYFSKEAAKQVSAGDEIKKGFFDAYLIAETTNAEGESRIKIVRAGSSTRLELDDLF